MQILIISDLMLWNTQNKLFDKVFILDIIMFCIPFENISIIICVLIMANSYQRL